MPALQFMIIAPMATANAINRTVANIGEMPLLFITILLIKTEFLNISYIAFLF
jgi:hypothetical protein